MSKITLDANHIYHNEQGDRIPSVTEIIQVAGLSYLPNESGDLLLSAIESGLESAEKWGVPAMAQTHYIEQARKFGNAVHLATELYDKQTLNMDTVDEAILPYLLAWEQFRIDFDPLILPENRERIVYSDKWKFAGKVDCIAVIKKELYTIDVKTTSIVQPSTAIQLAGYELAQGEKSRRLCVLLTKDGYKTVEYKDKTDQSIFICALQIYNWKRNHNAIKGVNSWKT